MFGKNINNLSFTMCRGLDNKVTVYPICMDEEMSARKKTVGTHTSYMSCCIFPNSDQQVNKLNECI